MAKAPPNTEDVPKELSVTDTAALLDNTLRVISMREFSKDVRPGKTPPLLAVPTIKFVM
jgi:hypothetical protein